MRPKIYLDMDGVLVNLGKYVKAYYDIKGPIPQWEVFKHLFGEQEFLREKREFFTSMDRHAWADLELHEGALELVELCKPLGDVCLLTAPPFFGAGEAAFGKNMWAQKHFPELPLIINQDKALFASPLDHLIDDKEENCRHFIANGGTAWLYPAETNVNSEMKRFDSKKFTNYFKKAENENPV